MSTVQSYVHHGSPLLSRLRPGIAIDLGTANTLIADSGGRILLREASVVALDSQGRLLACGSDAREMDGRMPRGVRLIRPFQAGMVAEPNITALMMKNFVKRLARRIAAPKPAVTVTVSTSATEVQRRAIAAAVASAGFRDFQVVPEPLAAAMGAGLSVAEPFGQMIVDIGAGLTEIAVLSLSGLVYANVVPAAGLKMDSAIVRWFQSRHNLLIGERTAERVKIAIGSAVKFAEPRTITVTGRCLVHGLPRDVTVGEDEIREAISPLVKNILTAIRSALEHVPGELSADLITSGICLTGGGAMLSGLDRLIAQDTGLPVRIAPTPLDSVVLGAATMLMPSSCGERHRGAPFA